MRSYTLAYVAYICKVELFIYFLQMDCILWTQQESDLITLWNDKQLFGLNFHLIRKLQEMLMLAVCIFGYTILLKRQLGYFEG